MEPRSSPQPATPWLAHLQPNPRADLRLFCFPYAGGAAAIYQRWADNMLKTIEVCPVELPGRGRRFHEPFYTRITSLATDLIEGLLPYFDKPFAFFGHSMGALLSFEVARQLRRRSLAGPKHLFVSGRGTPQIPEKEPPKHNLPDAEFIDELRRLNGTPKEILEHDELMQYMTPLIRADFALCETYEFTTEPPFDFPITAFGGLRDVEVTRERLEGWSAQTTGKFRLRMFPGDHFFIQTSDTLLLQTLNQELHSLLRASR